MLHTIKRFPLLGRSIRHKVMLGMIFCLLGFGGLGGVGYYYLTQMAFTLNLSSDMDDLSEDVAGARHIERQYIKYGQQEEHAEILGHVNRALTRLETLLQHVEANRHLDVSRQDRLLLPRLQNELKTYRTFLQALPSSTLSRREMVSQTGEVVAKTTRTLVLQLRDDQSAMVQALQWQLCWVVVTLLGLTLAGGWLAGRRILHALDIIEDATHRIAGGNFTPLALHSPEEETEQVINAINHMVGELEKRQHKLEQERKLASLGVLTAGIAHQLNNPLNNIYSTSQLLHEGVQEAAAGLRPSPALPEVEQKMDIVMQEIRRSRRIIRGLLNFSRESPLNATPCPLADVVHTALKLAASHFPPHTQVHNTVPDNIILPLDAQRFQEACINLFINAGEALQHDTGEIRICARQDEDSVLLEIADTGEGIPPEHMRKIFDPFFTSKSMGTGLGLSVAFGIIRQHEGSIGVKSILGTGTTFTLRLPRHRSSLQENPA